MTIKELLKKIRKEKADIKKEIKQLEKEITKKESDPKIFMANTLWEKAKIRRLIEKLEGGI